MKGWHWMAWDGTGHSRSPIEGVENIFFARQYTSGSGTPGYTNRLVWGFMHPMTPGYEDSKRRFTFELVDFLKPLTEEYALICVPHISPAGERGHSDRLLEVASGAARILGSHVHVIDAIRAVRHLEDEELSDSDKIRTAWEWSGADISAFRKAEVSTYLARTGGRIRAAMDMVREHSAPGTVVAGVSWAFDFPHSFSYEQTEGG